MLDPRPGTPLRAPALAWLAICLHGALPLAAQEEPRVAEGRIAGRVLEVEGGTAVEAVDVRLSSLGLATVTDAEGRFRFEDIPAGPQTLRVRHIAYGETELTVEVPDRATLAVTLRLHPRPVELEPLVVEVETELRARSLERQGFYDRRERAAGGEFFGPKELIAWPGLRLPELVARAAHARLTRGRVVFNRYAGRDCPAAFYVDGRRVRPPGSVPDLPLSEVAAVEAYRSFADLAGTGSVWYASPDVCGMVLVWTWRSPNPFH